MQEGFSLELIAVRRILEPAATASAVRHLAVGRSAPQWSRCVCSAARWRSSRNAG
jgi:hypothetical protein